MDPRMMMMMQQQQQMMMMEQMMGMLMQMMSGQNGGMNMASMMGQGGMNPMMMGGMNPMMMGGMNPMMMGGMNPMMMGGMNPMMMGGGGGQMPPYYPQSFPYRGAGGVNSGGWEPNSAPRMNPGDMNSNSPFGNSLARDAYGQANAGQSWNDGHHCYTGVKRALAQVGVNVSGVAAADAAPQLANNPHFREVKMERGQLPSLPAGAVVVWNKNPAAGHEYGHISVAMGNGTEASDKMRKQITGYQSSFRVFLPADDAGRQQGAGHQNNMANMA
jgi:hypothetical protein